MKARLALKKLRFPLLGAGAAALILATTTALAGSGVGGVFNLGQTNTVDAQTMLTGNPGENPLLRLKGSGTAATIRADSTSGIAVNGIATSGTGQYGQSTSGNGLFGVHTGTTGTTSGVYGQTASTDPASAGVTGRNLGGGPALQAVVTGTNIVPPLKVNSSAKVANLNADLLDGVDSTALQNRVSDSCAAGSAIRVVNANGTVSCEPVGGGGSWSSTGNAGTTPGTNFLGTTDNTALELKVNGQRALRLEPTTSTPNLIGGDSGNSVQAGAYGATIAGGGHPNPGLSNIVSARLGAIGGGWDNVAGELATVGGGESNTASAYATVAGGSANTASGLRSAVPGGFGNAASGHFSFAAGNLAKAMHAGSFVWSDSRQFDFASSADNSFSARATGGFKLVTGIDTNGDHTSFCILASGSGTWDCLSDRNAKEHFAAVDGRETLERLSRIPIQSWNFKSQDDSIRHMGPMAQDFRAAFGLGIGDKTIGGVDADGVAFSAIQGLYRQNQALERRNRTLAARLARQNARLNRLERALIRGLAYRQ
jgi:hypothetical protein